MNLKLFGLLPLLVGSDDPFSMHSLHTRTSNWTVGIPWYDFIGERTLGRSRVLACGFFFGAACGCNRIRPTYWPISGTAILCWMSCNDVSEIRGIQASHFSEGPGAFLLLCHSATLKSLVALCTCMLSSELRRNGISTALNVCMPCGRRYYFLAPLIFTGSVKISVISRLPLFLLD